MLWVRATRVGKDTFLAQIVRLVEEAQGSKVPIQAFADRVTAVFVPAVLAVALLTFAAWMLFPGAMRALVAAGSFLPWVDPNLGTLTLAIVATVAVLVIACPCALGLATPTALMVASGMGAERGILIRSGEALQTLRGVRMVVFDKTGTLTKGKPEVTHIVPADGVDRREVLRLAASAERGVNTLWAAQWSRGRKRRLSVPLQPGGLSGPAGAGHRGDGGRATGPRGLHAPCGGGRDRPETPGGFHCPAGGGSADRCRGGGQRARRRASWASRTR